MKKKFIIFCLLLLFSSCANGVGENKTTTFQIKSTEETNRGTPFYVYIKSTDFLHFLMDDYEKIATQKFLEKKDGTIVSTVIPGGTKTFEIKTKKDDSAAIYFLFTTPGEDWRLIIDDDKSKKVKILLGENEIEKLTIF